MLFRDAGCAVLNRRGSKKIAEIRMPNKESGSGRSPGLTGLGLKFSANREINRENCVYRRNPRNLVEFPKCLQCFTGEFPKIHNREIFLGIRESFGMNRDLRRAYLKDCKRPLD
jgi:hypothetical protein